MAVQVPAAWYLQGAGVAAAAGGDAGPHQQHGVRVETEAGAVQGVREGADHHPEDQ